MPGAGVGPGSGKNRVGFKVNLEQDSVPVPKSGVGVDAPNGAQAGSGKTLRDKIVEAVEVLRLLLGQSVCSQVEELFRNTFSHTQKLLPPH